MRRWLLPAALVLALVFVVASLSTLRLLAVQDTDCRSVLPNRLIVRERGRVSAEDPSPLNVREGPGTSFDPPLGNIPVGGIFYVLEGPTCSPIYAWYRVEYVDEAGETLTGWIAEGNTSRYFVETYPPGE